MIKWVKSLFGTKRLRESVAYPFGRPLPPFDVLPGGRYAPLYGTNYRYSRTNDKPGKPHGIATLEELEAAVALSQRLVTENPNGVALMRGLTSFVVGCGPSIKLVAQEEGREPDPTLVADATGVLKRFMKANRFPSKVREMLRRRHRDGDLFLRLYPDEITRVRFVNAHQVRPPSDGTEAWSWGILTDEDTEPLAYGVWYGQDFEQVDPVFIVHSKANADENAKRGTPSFYACGTDLEQVARLRYAALEGARAREGISYVVQHESASRDAVQALADAERDYSLDRYSAEGGSREVTYTYQDVGERLEVNKGQELLPPPGSPNSAYVEMLMRAGLQAACARWNAPLWMGSSDHQDTNYAASLTAEAPFTKSIEVEQGELAEPICDLLTRVLEIAVEMGDLPASALDELEVSCTFPSPVVRDPLQEAQRLTLLMDKGVITSDEAREEQGYAARQHSGETIGGTQ